MPAGRSVKARAPRGRKVDLQEAAERLGYASQSLRNMVFKPPKWAAGPPPLFKVRGRWYAWTSELDEWIAKADATAEVSS